MNEAQEFECTSSLACCQSPVLITRSGDGYYRPNVLHDMLMHICEPVVAALEAVGEALGVEA